MKKLIKVEQKHIDNGARCMTFCCPVALACRGAGLTNTSVGSRGNVAGFVGGVYFSTTLPDDITTLVGLYDNGAEMKPFEFELEIPE